MSFGRYLKAIRENQGISLKDLSAEICVPTRQLELIEAEDIAGMPEEVYAKGLLRAYAEAVGVDPEDIIGRYKSDLEARARALRLERDALRSGKRNLIRAGLAIGVLGVVMAGTLYGTGLVNDAAMRPNGTGAGVQEEQAGREIDFEAGNTSDGAENGNSGSEKLRTGTDSDLQVLSVNATSETIISISVDGRRSEKYRLDPKDYLELAARSSFRISINDPASVSINFNGEPVDITAESGQQPEIVLSEGSKSGK
ncbi:MAG: helix-turn-helix domain-containing protein [Desulfosalsimonas sp.]